MYNTLSETAWLYRTSISVNVRHEIYMQGAITS